MSLFVFLVITIILCSLILLVQGGDNNTIKLLAVLSIVAEVLLLLVAKGLEMPLPLSVSRVVPCITGLVGLYGIFKSNERSIPLLVFFASLLQFFVEANIIDSVR
jgi:hypothetical protein